MLLDCVHRNVCKFTKDRPCIEIHCVDFLQEGEAEKTASPNTTNSAIALCKRAVNHVKEVGDIPTGHPIIVEMMKLIA